MGKRLGRHLRSHLVGYIALAGFAIAGSAQAVDGPVPGTNTVGSEDIIDDEVRSADIANGRIFNVDIADESIQPVKIKDGTLAEVDFGLNALTGSEVNESNLFNDNSLTTADVSDAKLFNDDSLTVADLAPFAAGSAEVASGAVATSEVEDDSLAAGDLGVDSVGSSEIATNAVRSSELGPVVVELDTGRDLLFGGNPDGGYQEVSASCPAGFVRLNVGFAAALDVELRGTQGSTVQFENTSSEARAVEVFAICLKA